MTAIYAPSAYRVYVAFSDGPLVESPTWTNVSAYFMSISTNRGRSSELDDFQAGTCTVVLHNRDRRFDPTHSAGPYYGDLLPRRQIKVEAVVGATTYPVFRGVISSWRQTWAHDDGQTCTVEAVDIASLLARRSFSGDAMSAIVSSIPPSGWWPLDGEFMDDAMGLWPGAYSLRTEGPPIGYLEASSLTENFGVTSERLGAATFTPGASTKSTIACLVDVGAVPGGSELLRVNVASGIGWEWYLSVSVDRVPTAFCSIVSGIIRSATATGPAIVSGVQHLAAVRDGTTVKLYVNGELVDSDTNASMTLAQTPTGVTLGASSSSIETSLSMGHAQVWNGVALTDTQIAAVANAALYGRLGATTSDMTDAILDLCSVPAGLRSVTESSQGVGPYRPSDAWSALQVAARSDPGRVFVSRAGVVTFEPRTVDMGASATAAFADDSTVGAIRYAGYELESTDRWVFNDITVTGSAGASASVRDQASVDVYDALAHSVDTVLPDANSCRALAESLLSRYATPSPRGSGWVCDPTDDAQFAAVLAVELGDVVTVKRTPPVGSAHTSTVQITSISHSVEAQSASVTFSGAPVDTTAAGVWDSGLWDSAVWG